MKVFMMVFNPTGYNKVSPLIENVTEQVANFIEPWIESSIRLGPPYKEKKDTHLHVSINKYCSEADGLSGNYDDFFTYTNLVTNEQHILSPNEQKLKAFCAFINRITS